MNKDNKIYKHANLYDKDGNLLRHVDQNGILQKYNLKELEELVDKLGNEKDNNGNIKDPIGFNNASYVLFQMYQKYGYPQLTELLKNFAKTPENESETSSESEASSETEINSESETSSEYIDYEEIK